MSVGDWLDSWPGAVTLTVAVHLGFVLLPIRAESIDTPEELVEFELFELPAIEPPPEDELPPGELNPDPEADPELPSVESNRPAPEEPEPHTPIVTGIAVDEASVAPDGMAVGIGNTDEPGFEAAPGTDLTGVGGFEGGGRGGGGTSTAANPDRPPKLVRFFKPRYPDKMVHTGIEGRVVLLVEVLPNGRAGNAEVLSTVHPDLSQVALVAIKRYRWRPAVLNGEKIASTDRISFRFTIDTR